MATGFTLGKKERLKSRKQIEALFKTGRNFSVFPYRVYFQQQPGAATHSLCFGVGVSSRHFKRAVDRNRVKRLTREAYRTQKNELADWLQVNGKGLNVFFIYTGQELPDFHLVKEKTGLALKKLMSIAHEMVSSPA